MYVNSNETMGGLLTRGSFVVSRVCVSVCVYVCVCVSLMLDVTSNEKNEKIETGEFGEKKT